MAYMEPKHHCYVCNKDFSPNSTAHGGCPHCEAAVEATRKAAHFDMLDKLTLEERVRRLEEQQYEHNKVRRGYISPPRY